MKKLFSLAIALLWCGMASVSHAGDFEDRCADPNVIRCYGFDDFVDITTRNPRNTVPQEPASRMYDPNGGIGNCTLQGSTACWDLDTATKVSGASSLRFQIQSQTPADSSGSFRLNFADDYSERFGEGEEFYVQYRYRVSPAMLTAFPGSDGYKSMIVGAGDWPGGTRQNSCTILEAVIQTDNRWLGPYAYHSCGNFNRMEWWDSGTCNQMRLQTVVNESSPKYCCYGDYPGGCWVWTADEWMTMQMHVQIGQWNAPGTSRIRVWGAREGETSVLIFDSNIGGTATDFAGRIINDDTANLKYGKVWFLPYNTRKDSTAVHDVGYVWYDDLIISRARIPDPGTSPPNDQVPAIPGNLKAE